MSDRENLEGRRRHAAEVLDLVRKHGSVKAAASATGVHRNTMQGRYFRAMALLPGYLPQSGLRANWAKSAVGPVEVREVQPQDPIELRRENDLIAGLKRRVKQLEGELISAQDWQSKADSLLACPVEPAGWKHPSPRITRGNVLTPVLFSSDFQVGEVVRPSELDGINEYNQDVFCSRYQLMIDKTIDLANNNTGATEFPGAIYLRGGDAISGEIHEELAQTNDLSSIPALRVLQRQEREGIRRLRDRFGRVRVISIPGNHGRTTFKSHAKGYSERSYETMLAWWLADSFDHDPNVTFWAPPSGEALFDVAGWQVLMSHGDRMGSRGGTGFIGPAANIAKGHRKLYDNWTLTGRRIDLILSAHFHTSLKLERGYANGSLAGYNEYARDLRATPDAAKQWLFFMHEREMVSHAFELALSQRPRRSSEEFQL